MRSTSPIVRVGVDAITSVRMRRMTFDGSSEENSRVVQTWEKEPQTQEYRWPLESEAGEERGAPFRTSRSNQMY